MRAKYTVLNTYGITGGSTHLTPEAALKARDKREGDGWQVIDSAGNRWEWNGPDACVAG